VMANPVIVDLRNVYRPSDMERHGFAYTSIGRGMSSRSSGNSRAKRNSSKQVGSSSEVGVGS